MSTPAAFVRVNWRGVDVNAITKRQLTLTEKDLGFPLVAYQGSYRPITRYSSDTHHGGMAVDVAPTRNPGKVVRALRRRGFAAWFRAAIKGLWDAHIHMILVADPTDASAGAKDQVVQYRHKPPQNGLAGRGADKSWHPSPIPVVHWTVPATHLDVSLYQINCASKKPRWTWRARSLAARIMRARPNVITADELYIAQRGYLVALLRSRYSVAVTNRGKVVLYDRTVYRRVKGTDKAFRLGNGKDAAGVKLQHKTTGKFFNVVAFHLSVSFAQENARAAEAKSMVHQSKAAYPANHTIFAGDANDSIKSTSARPHDTTGRTMAAFGYVDSEKRARKIAHESWNTSNRFLDPAPTDGVHIDRVFTSKAVQVLSYAVDAYSVDRPADYLSDHFGIRVTLRIPI